MYIFSLAIIIALRGKKNKEEAPIVPRIQSALSGNRLFRPRTAAGRNGSPAGQGNNRRSE